MHPFEQANLYVYLSAQEAVLDGAIWCLGPYVDDSRGYGAGRIVLARVTRSFLRPWCRSRAR